MTGSSRRLPQRRCPVSVDEVLFGFATETLTHPPKSLSAVAALAKVAAGMREATDPDFLCESATTECTNPTGCDRSAVERLRLEPALEPQSVSSARGFLKKLVHLVGEFLSVGAPAAMAAG